jgi:ATP-dependent DNA ligase
MKYSTFRYIYPPRPKNTVPNSDIPTWDNGSFIAQPKLNGSNCVIFMNEEKTIVMNRHNQRLTNFKISEEELRELYRGSGWMVLNGEYLNKSQRDENRVVFNHKFVIFDILVYNSDYLIGKTFEDRVSLLNELYNTNESEKDFLYIISENVYRVKTFEHGFKQLFEKFNSVEMVEGLVMKRKRARLELGTTENNNIKSQIKSRKQTKNYLY